MKKIKRLVAISICAVISAVAFTGCSTNEAALLNALNKANQNSSMEIKADMSVNVSAKNLSKDEEQTTSEILPILNNSKVSMSAKINQNQERTISKEESSINMRIGSMPMNMGVWIDSDLTASPQKMQQIVKIPDLAAASLPDNLAGKQYMIMDANDISNVTGGAKVDYSKIAKFTKDFEPKIADFTKNLLTKFNPGLNMITDLGEKTIVQGNQSKIADIYELKLNDKAFKQLMRYTENNFAANKDAVKFMKEYMIASLSLAGMTTDETKEAQGELEAAFNDFIEQTPNIINGMNSALDKLDKIRILGDKGIDIKFAVDRNGNIINEAGTIQLVLDMNGIDKLSEEKASANNPTGIYTIGIDFNEDITNINGDVKVTYPTLTSDNSFKYSDLLKVSPEAKKLQKSLSKGIK